MKPAFKAWVLAERNRLDISQAELGRRCGVDAGTVSRWERGIIMPHVHAFRSLCAAFGKDPTEILETVEIPTPIKPKRKPRTSGVRRRGAVRRKRRPA